MWKLTVCTVLLSVSAGWTTSTLVDRLNQTEVLVVLSSDSAQFKAAAQSAVLALTESGVSTQTYSITDLKPSDIQSLSGTVLAVGGKASKTLVQNLPSTTRLYYCMVPSPDQIGLTMRNNTSGISSDADLGQQIELIKISSNSINRIGAYYRSSSPSSTNRIKAMADSMPSNFELISVDLDQHKSVSNGIKSLIEKDVDLIWTTPDPAVYNSATVKALLMECLKQRIPLFGFSHSLVRAGSTFGIGINPSSQGARIAQMIHRGTIDLHHSPELTLAINKIVADRIQFKFNSAIRNRAEVVFDSD